LLTRGDDGYRKTAREIISLRAWNGFGMVVAVPRVTQEGGEDCVVKGFVHKWHLNESYLQITPLRRFERNARQRLQRDGWMVCN
jgi:hypothetical protein